MGTETDGFITFFDLKLERSNNTISFDMYRKPTQTDHTIHFNPFYHIQHTMSGIKFLVHHLLNILLSEENFQKELTTIYWLAINNAFKPFHVTSVLNKYTRKALRFNSSALSNVTTVESSFVKFSYVAYKSDDTFQKSLVHNKGSINFLSRSGVYKHKCGEPGCKSVYIGRIKEHLHSKKHNYN